MVQEMERHRDSELEDAVAAIRRAVAEEHEVLQVHDVVLVRTGTIAKTSSGKIQRHNNRKAWREDTLAVVNETRRREQRTGRQITLCSVRRQRSTSRGASSLDNAGAEGGKAPSLGQPPARRGRAILL